MGIIAALLIGLVCGFFIGRLWEFLYLHSPKYQNKIKDEWH